MPNNRLLNEDGLYTYHRNMVKALNEKANKVHVGSSAPNEKFINIWISTGELVDEELYFESDNV